MFRDITIRRLAVPVLAAAATLGFAGVASAQSDFYAKPMNSGPPNMMMMTPMGAMQQPPMQRPMMQESMANRPMMKKRMSRKMMMKKKMMMEERQKPM